MCKGCRFYFKAFIDCALHTPELCEFRQHVSRLKFLFLN